MKKIWIMLFGALIAFSGNTFASWTYVGRTDDAAYFVDLSTIKSNGRFKEAWTLTDYNSLQKHYSGKLYMSDKSKQRYDCSLDKKQNLLIVFYQEHMGEGSVVESTEVESLNLWNHIVPDSVGDAIQKRVCKK
jgi:hypothetical protein